MLGCPRRSAEQAGCENTHKALGSSTHGGCCWLGGFRTSNVTTDQTIRPRKRFAIISRNFLELQEKAAAGRARPDDPPSATCDFPGCRRQSNPNTRDAPIGISLAGEAALAE